MIFAVVSFTRHFPLLARVLFRRMTAPLIRVGWVLYGHQFLLLERLFLDPVDPHYRRRHFFIEAAVDADHLIGLHFAAIKNRGGDNHCNGVGFIAKAVAVVTVLLDKIAA